MHSEKQQTRRVKAEPAIRASVLCGTLGVAVLCIVAISVSRKKVEEPNGTAAASASALRQDLPLTQSVRAYRGLPTIASAPDASSNNETEPSRATEIARGISNELRGAREKLTELRYVKHYADEHTEMQQQMARIKSLEQSAALPEAFLGLVKARAELASLRVVFGDSHADVQEQLQVIQSFENSAAAREQPELAEAKAELQRLRVRFSDSHSAVQAQLRKFTEIQK